MSTVLNFSAQLQSEICASCGVHFAVPLHFMDKRREDKQSFFCPNGHSLAYSQSEVSRLKKELERERQAKETERRWREGAQQAERRQFKRASAFKAVATKMKRRLSNGVCPCCNRTFQNLMGHMKTQHPKYSKK